VRVLIVDDEQDIRLLCRVNLEHAGHEVLEASGAEQGMELALNRQPDLIVLDMMLPRTDGPTVLRELRLRPETADIPVVLLTAKVLRADRARGWEAGCVAYVTKPFSPAELVALLAEVHAMSSEERSRRRARALAELRRPL
jgi:DNA-binding response OmpR family regulator